MWKSAEKSVTSSTYFKIQTAQLFRIWYLKLVWFSITESETIRLSIINAWRRYTAELETIFCISICMSGGRFRLSITNKCLDRRRIHNKLGPNHWCLVQEKKMYLCIQKKTEKCFLMIPKQYQRKYIHKRRRKPFHSGIAKNYLYWIGCFDQSFGAAEAFIYSDSTKDLSRYLMISPPQRCSYLMH